MDMEMEMDGMGMDMDGNDDLNMKYKPMKVCGICGDKALGKYFNYIIIIVYTKVETFFNKLFTFWIYNKYLFNFVLSFFSSILPFYHSTIKGYNFNAVTCEACKAFFRRNALRTKVNVVFPKHI